MKKTILLTVFCLFSCVFTLKAQSAFDKMTNAKMQKILLREAKNVEGENGSWRFEFGEKQLFIVTDENFNRMRIISPIAPVTEMKAEQYKILLESNFDKALDAKYAIYEEWVWSVFTHPLGELTVEQFKDAMKQVAKLSSTFGTTFTSTDFVFGTANEGG